MARRAGIEGDSMMFPGGARLCRISNMAIYRALGVENIRHRRKAKVLVLPFAGGVSPSLGWFLFFSASYPQDRRSYYLFL